MYAYNKWYHRILEVGDNDNCVGQTIKDFQIAAHPQNDNLEEHGVVLYDNIVIKNNGEVKLVIFQNA